MRAFLNWDTFFTCLLIFATTTALYYIPTNFDFLNPIKQAIGDFDITDMAQSRFRDNDAIAIDTSIVLVNLSTLNRAGIADMVDKLNAAGPAVIGIDAMFRKPKSPDADSSLAQAFRRVPHLVLGCKIDYDDSVQAFDSVETQCDVFARCAERTGFYNVISDDDKSFRTVRNFSPKEMVNTDTVLNFAAAVCQAYDATSTMRLLSRNNSTEQIYFRGGTQDFYNLDAEQVLDSSADLSFIRNKIVLIGFIGERIDTVPHSLEDVFFTPLNSNYAGRAFPDMYGVVIHANVVSQILHRQYINEMPLWLALLLSFVMCVSTVACFNIIEEHLPFWYDALTIAIFLLQSLALTFLHIVVFNNLHYKLNITVSLAALALTPTLHEIYHNSIKPLFWKAVGKFRRKKA